jgi:hypothetical protein
MESVSIGEKAKPPSSLQAKDDPGHLLIFCKDIIPDRDEFLKGNRKVKVPLYRLKKNRRGDFSHIKVIYNPLLKIEELRKYFLRFLEFFPLRESREFFCNLIMTEREDDIAEIKQDHFNRFLSIPHSAIRIPKYSKLAKFAYSRNSERWLGSSQGSCIVSVGLGLSSPILLPF